MFKTHFCLGIRIALVTVIPVATVATLPWGQDEDGQTTLTAGESVKPYSFEKIHTHPETPSPSLPTAQRPLTIGANVERLIHSKDPVRMLEAAGLVSQCVQLESFERSGQILAAQMRRQALFAGERGTCDSLTPLHRQAYAGWIVSAAEARVPGAAQAMLDVGPHGNFADLQLRPNDPLVAQWLKDVSDLLRSDAKDGDANAAATLAEMSREPAYAVNDEVAAVGYDLATVRLLRAQQSREGKRMAREADQKLRQMSDADRDRALSIADSIIRPISDTP
ncbi:hypothetical protein [Roseateles amylovorans]|uniref:Secreted protein n=1 Tax=Roseateles amylovorans TaxID=2978473 RepID=A0ABY6B555_9BURK|nr:hypothetical protein [Roseateles amylovorans]UXH80059.1 hypothetical protein N4261_09330 [Roseateles amylovorans]